MSAAVNEPASVPLQPGEMLAGRYRIERTVGSGGMGIVFAATHVELQQPVAIKVLLPEALRAPGAKDRFLREVRTVARMKTEHVARVFDAGTLDSGQPFAVMELLDGQDLSKLLEERGALPIDEAASLLLQTCEALAEAHQLGIVHRDLKPENMFITTGVDKRPFVKIIDFGLAKSLTPADKEGKADALTTSFTVMGTPLYMSPEQLRSTRDVDHRSDIWSLGVVAYEMLEGRPPFDGEALADLCATIVRDPVPKMTRSSIPRELEAVVLQCLEKEASARFTKIAHLAASLAEYARDDDRPILDRILRVQPMTAPPPKRMPSDPDLAPISSVSAAHEEVATAAPLPGRRGAARIVGIGAAGLIVGVVVVTLALRAGRDRDDAPVPVGIVAQGSIPTPITPPITPPVETSLPAPSASVVPMVPSAPASEPRPATKAPVAKPVVATSPPASRPPVTPPRPSAKPTPRDPLESR